MPKRLSAEVAEFRLLEIDHIPLSDFREKWENTPSPTLASLSLFTLCPSGNPATARYVDRVSSGRHCICDDCGNKGGGKSLSAKVAEIELLKVKHIPLPDFREMWENTTHPTCAPLSLFALCPSGNPATGTYSSKVNSGKFCSCDDCGYGNKRLSAEVAELRLLEIDHIPLSDFREKWENAPSPTKAPLSLFALCPSGNPATGTYNTRVNTGSRCGCDDCGRHTGGYRDNRSGGIYITDHGHVKTGKSQVTAISRRIRTHQQNFGKIKYWRVWIWEDGSIGSKVEREVLDFLRYWHLSVGHDLREQNIRRGIKDGDTELFPRSIFTMPGALERHIERIIAKYPAPIQSYSGSTI